ncbi:MAG: TonB-dependent receptor, partial [Pyrinomonadaceae bacterium]|nr:TonB-dependent receptor [Pyrinomonadaceae bacterium]
MFAILLCVISTLGQQSTGTLRGQLTDQFGAAIVGATVIVADAAGVERNATTNGEGAYVLGGLAPGSYTVRATANGFALYEKAGVEVPAGRPATLNISLSVSIAEEQVTVGAEAPLNTDAENNASALVLRGSDLETLPDDPEDLAAALQALAGPSAGPNGGQIFIDGFTGGRLPPRESIREIRINQNPFAAEYDRLGFGRVEILTKPGTDRLRGQVSFEFEDEALNSRNSFAPNRAPFQSREFGGNLGGSLFKNKASFFLDFERRSIDDNAVINALVLDPSLNISRFPLAVVTPNYRTTFSPRFDYQLNSTNTLIGRYSYARSGGENNGVGNFDLLSRAFNSASTEHTVQLTETAVLNSSVVNETRFQFIRRRSTEEGDNSQPTIRVLDAFTGGGAGVGLAFSNEDRYELQNYTSFSLGNHALKAGGRLRGSRLADSSPNNFAGTFTFTSIEQYRDTLLDLPGVRPRQFTIAGGDPLARVSQIDFGAFVQDDWRVRPNLSLSLGLRYETQTNINSNFNFAPRFSFAYSPGASGQGRPSTVIRGGFGIFYDRLGENLVLQASRFNGINQQQFVVTDPSILDGVTFTQNGVGNVPTVDTLNSFALPQTVRRLADDLQAPYTIQTALSIERQLPFNTTLSATYLNARTLHLLRSRNINAPLLGVNGNLVRPLGDVGNIYQYESSGRFNQNQLIFNLRSQFNRNVSVFANYALGKANSDTDGVGTFPANPYDLTGEYGRSLLDIRHRFVVGSSVTMPWNVRLSPFVIFRSGVPYNITSGEDLNGDTLFAERPAFATDLADPDVVNTRFGAFDTTPTLGQAIIPRNFGEGPNYFVVNLRASKTLGFGAGAGSGAASHGGGGGRGGRGGGDPFGGGGGGGGGFGG